MRRFILPTALLVAAPALAGYAAWSEEPHLNVVARTADETARIAKVLAPPEDFSAPEPFEAMSGGAATSQATANANAFSHPSANMDYERRLDFFVGNGIFKKLWVSAPASTEASDGLGPLYNARSCQRCHFKDGRGHMPEPGADDATSLLLRVSIPWADDPLAAEIEGWIGTAPDPVYGEQIQEFAIPGHVAEGSPQADWVETEVALSGGETVSLRRPDWRIAAPGYGPLHPDATLSARVASPMIGLGLLEAIPAERILSLADPDDADGDGISGRPAVVWSDEFERPMVGRFGWKAGAPTVRAQSAGAFRGDVGVSTPLHPENWGECSPSQAACRDARHGGAFGGVEADETTLELVTFYSRNLAVPVRRDVDDPEVLRGKEMFHAAGCAACHTPKHVTHRLSDQPEQSFQLIWPYTDMLLHDMGEGLADGRPEGRATGREWRTPPLWGIGLTKTIDDRAGFLHDGRARTLLEAALWHGGEAKAARDAVADMPKADRDALIRFLESL